MTTLIYDKLLEGIKVFTKGTHTDSRGHKDEYTQKDLDLMVEAFNEKVISSVPAKAGHSSEDFVAQVAKELDVPKSLIMGEGERGRGAVRFGEITKLTTNGGELYADLRLHDRIGGMIETGLFNGISLEIMKDREGKEKTYPYVVAGIALLGAQRPSLGHLPSLQAQMFEGEDGNYYEGAIYERALHYAPERDARGRFVPKNSGADNEVKDGDNIYDVAARIPDKTKPSGFSQVYARVAAPNEITARAVALRALENFLFNFGNPAGQVLGGAIAAIAVKKIFLGKPRLAPTGTVRGVGQVLKSIFEESLDMATHKDPTFSFLYGDGYDPDFLYAVQMIPPGIDEQAWRECLKEAGLAGHTDAEAYCIQKLGAVPPPGAAPGGQSTPTGASAPPGNGQPPPAGAQASPTIPPATGAVQPPQPAPMMGGAPQSIPVSVPMMATPMTPQQEGMAQGSPMQGVQPQGQGSGQTPPGMEKKEGEGEPSKDGEEKGPEGEGPPKPEEGQDPPGQQTPPTPEEEEERRRRRMSEYFNTNPIQLYDEEIQVNQLVGQDWQSVHSIEGAISGTVKPHQPLYVMAYTEDADRAREMVTLVADSSVALPLLDEMMYPRPYNIAWMGFSDTELEDPDSFDLFYGDDYQEYAIGAIGAALRRTGAQITRAANSLKGTVVTSAQQFSAMIQRLGLRANQKLTVLFEATIKRTIRMVPDALLPQSVRDAKRLIRVQGNTQEVIRDVQDLWKSGFIKAELRKISASMARADVARAAGTVPGGTLFLEEGDKMLQVNSRVEAAEKAAKDAQTEVSELKAKLRTTEYHEQVEKLTLVPGEAPIMAARLYEIETKLGQDAANEQLRSWYAEQVKGEELKVATTTLTPRSSEEVQSFEAAISKYMDDNPDATRRTAFVEIGKKHPELREATRPGV